MYSGENYGLITSDIEKGISDLIERYSWKKVKQKLVSIKKGVNL